MRGWQQILLLDFGSSSIFFNLRYSAWACVAGTPALIESETSQLMKREKDPRSHGLGVKPPRPRGGMSYGHQVHTSVEE